MTSPRIFLDLPQQHLRSAPLGGVESSAFDASAIRPGDIGFERSNAFRTALHVPRKRSLISPPVADLPEDARSHPDQIVAGKAYVKCGPRKSLASSIPKICHHPKQGAPDSLGRMTSRPTLREIFELLENVRC